MGCGKSRSVESEENQKTVSLASHRPWKSRTTRGIPTFPTAPTAAGIFQTKSGNLIVVDRKECLTPDTLATEAPRYLSFLAAAPLALIQCQVSPSLFLKVAIRYGSDYRCPNICSWVNLGAPYASGLR
jgi:hypothetical protein